MAEHYDVAIIGGGPGGYVAAIRAAQLGLSTVLVEREHLGGICLNWGCIPTKALLRSAEVLELARHAGEFGVELEVKGFDLARMVQRSRDVSARLMQGIGYLMKKNGVTVIEGSGRLIGPGTIAVETGDGASQSVSARQIVLATGARARSLPGIEPDGEHIWTYREAMLPPALPKSLLVIGSGAIGIEFASFYRTLGTEVTVVEILDRILPAEDAEISALARKAFEAKGMRILTGTRVTSVGHGSDGIAAELESADGARESLAAERAILAVGIVGNTEQLGLDNVGVETENGHVVTNEFGETSAPGIHAIGDLTGAPWLAHKASHEGVMVAERIAGHTGVEPLDTSRIPGCTYASPQVASIGLTEDQALEQGLEVKIGRFPFTGNGKALALGESEGLVKTVVDAGTGELLGAHLIGTEVTELIHAYSVARTLEATTDELKETVFPHPTLSEMLHEAVLDADGVALHI
jgi:dihydrolipoamide dehydrogenase